MRQVVKEFTYQYTCQRCHRMFFLVKLRGGRTLYCDECRGIVLREKTLLRVRAFRQRTSVRKLSRWYADFKKRWGLRR